jgi:S1-C subfamily serine protease
MRRSISWMLLALVVGCGSATPNVPRVRLTAKGIFDEASPAIVRVEAGGDKIGTGFIVDKGGIVATNLHVVAGEAEIKVKLQDGSFYKVMRIAGVDAVHDLTLLKIQPVKSLPTVKLGDSNIIGAGDQVFAIGNPLGVLDNSISGGLVSSVRVLCSDQDVQAHGAVVAHLGPSADAVRRELSQKDRRTPEEEDTLHKLNCSQEYSVLQISTPISQGSSGGPLFNQFGEVVGVTTAIIGAGQNLNIAMPAKYLKPLVVQQPNAMGVDQFAKLTREDPEERGEHVDSDDDTTPPPRQVPSHELSIWEGCQPNDIAETVSAIWDAIEIGAPLYNKQTTCAQKPGGCDRSDKKGFEECFRVYEGTALRLEQGGGCKGVRAAFGDGLLRASAAKSFKDKAWAMRDTFDGLIAVANKWCAKDPNACKALAPRHP